MPGTMRRSRLGPRDDRLVTRYGRRRRASRTAFPRGAWERVGHRGGWVATQPSCVGERRVTPSCPRGLRRVAPAGPGPRDGPGGLARPGMCAPPQPHSAATTCLSSLRDPDEQVARTTLVWPSAYGTSIEPRGGVSLDSRDHAIPDVRLRVGECRGCPRGMASMVGRPGYAVHVRNYPGTDRQDFTVGVVLYLRGIWLGCGRITMRWMMVAVAVLTFNCTSSFTAIPL